MFRKPALPATGNKENGNVMAPRPRLGMSSLMHHTAAKQVDKDLESAGASLKVLTVENSRQTKPTTGGTSTTTTNRLSNKPAPTGANAITASASSSANQRTSTNDLVKQNSEPVFKRPSPTAVVPKTTQSDKRNNGKSPNSQTNGVDAKAMANNKIDAAPTKNVVTNQAAKVEVSTEL